jgi:hypothetical protein
MMRRVMVVVSVRGGMRMVMVGWTRTMMMMAVASERPAIQFGGQIGHNGIHLVWFLRDLIRSWNRCHGPICIEKEDRVGNFAIQSLRLRASAKSRQQEDDGRDEATCDNDGKDLFETLDAELRQQHDPPCSPQRHTAEVFFRE